MTDHNIAPSERYRAPTRSERLARAVAARLGGGIVRRVLRRGYRIWQNISTRGRGLESRLPGGEVVRVLPAWNYVTWNARSVAATSARAVCIVAHTSPT